MKKWITILILATMAIMLCPQLVGAASTVYIDVTATGSEVTITTNCTTWALGTVHANDNIATAINYCNVTNLTSQEVEITIHGNQMADTATGVTEVWTLDNTSTPAANVFCMFLGVDDASDNWDVVINDTDDLTFNKIQFDADTTLAVSDCWTFGLDFWAPASSVGNVAMMMCDDADSVTDDTNNGLVLIATV